MKIRILAGRTLSARRLAVGAEQGATVTTAGSPKADF